MTKSRRDFLKGSVATTAAIAGAGMLAGCQGQAADEYVVPVPKKWDMEYDVVVVGYGVAGACAALEAHDAGAKVAILEKASMGGGSTAISGGMFCLGGGTALQKAVGVDETPEEFYQFLMAQGGGLAQEELQRVHADKSVETYHFLTDTLGLEFPQRLSPTVCGQSMPCGKGGLAELGGLGYVGNEGYPAVATRVTPKPHVHCQPGRGAGFFEALKGQCERCEIAVQYDMGATELIVDANNCVLGLYAEGPAGTKSLKANKAVVLAAGGYGHNKEIVKGLSLNYMDDVATRPATNTGDGIVMAQRLGAQMFLCDGASFLYPCGPTVVMMTLAGVFDPPEFTVLYVDRRGKRIASEDWHISTHALAWARTNSFVANDFFSFSVFDEASRAASYLDLASPDRWRAGTTVTTALGDTVPNITVSGQTIEELCEASKQLDFQGRGIDPDGLRETIKNWNTFVANQKDEEWGRVIGLVPIETPPYYASAMWPRMVNEATGIKINAKSQVMHVNGQSISRLYAAGRVTGGQYAQLYTCGTALASGVIMGRIAGQNAAKEVAWS